MVAFKADASSLGLTSAVDHIKVDAVGSWTPTLKIYDGSCGGAVVSDCSGLSWSGQWVSGIRYIVIGGASQYDYGYFTLKIWSGNPEVSLLC